MQENFIIQVRGIEFTCTYKLATT